MQEQELGAVPARMALLKQTVHSELVGPVHDQQEEWQGEQSELESL